MKITLRTKHNIHQTELVNGRLLGLPLARVPRAWFVVDGDREIPALEYFAVEIEQAQRCHARSEEREKARKDSFLQLQQAKRDAEKRELRKLRRTPEYRAQQAQRRIEREERRIDKAGNERSRIAAEAAKERLRYYTSSELVALGWTRYAIRKFLKPDKIEEYTYGRYSDRRDVVCHLFLKANVTKAKKRSAVKAFFERPRLYRSLTSDLVEAA